MDKLKEILIEKLLELDIEDNLVLLNIDIHSVVESYTEMTINKMNQEQLNNLISELL